MAVPLGLALRIRRFVQRIRRFLAETADISTSNLVFLLRDRQWSYCWEYDTKVCNFGNRLREPRRRAYPTEEASTTERGLAL
jgi:hypothetical protein